MATVGDAIRPVGPWDFSGSVAANFDTHAARSIPGYNTGHQIIASLSDHFIRPGSTAYDIGCSTGTLLAMLSEQHSGARLVGIDCEPDMVSVARCRLANSAVQVFEADATKFPWESADLFIACYTLQFVPLASRPALLADIYGALNPGGALILFEKVLAPSPRLQDIAAQAYVDHKLSVGYTPAEITAKSRSLRGVMQPLTSAANRVMLHAAGFSEVMTVHQHLCFEGVLAVKGVTP